MPSQMHSFYVFVYKEAIKMLKNLENYVGQSNNNKDYNIKKLQGDLRKDVISKVVEYNTLLPILRKERKNIGFNFESKIETANSILNEIKEGYTSLDYKVIDLKFKTKKNFIVGTKQGPLYLVFEVGLSWDPILDLPFIPGSSLKGVIRSYMLDLCKTKSDKIKECVENVISLFGVPTRDEEIAKLVGLKSNVISEEGSEGLVVFSDAYPIAFSDTYGLLTPDIINPHYYKGGEGVVDNEFKVQPIPITFLSVAPEVTFRSIIAVSSEGEKYVKNLSEMFFSYNNNYSLVPFIVFAFTMGIGARTSRGYGEFELLGLDPLCDNVQFENLSIVGLNEESLSKRRRAARITWGEKK